MELREIDRKKRTLETMCDHKVKIGELAKQIEGKKAPEIRWLAIRYSMMLARFGEKIFRLQEEITQIEADEQIRRIRHDLKYRDGARDEKTDAPGVSEDH